MTSIALLLGLAASHFGTMDTTITRLLSVHVVAILPPKSAELNLSNLTQTAGIMGIGLVYYNSQHRRLSEVMLTELERQGNMLSTVSTANLEIVRDECYRLAAGFALGFINIAKANSFLGLRDLQIPQKLLDLAGADLRTQDLKNSSVATPGALMALSLIYLKSNDASMAKKLELPTTAHLMAYIRPDVQLLRVVTKQCIMWESIGKDEAWLRSQVPGLSLPKVKLPRMEED